MYLRPTVCSLGILFLSLVSSSAVAKPRNPFGVADVPRPIAKDVSDFAARAKLTGDDRDENAEQWATTARRDGANSFDGQWDSRWNGGSAAGSWIAGTAEVKTVGDRVYILYKDRTNTYLIEALRDGNDRLVGRYINLGCPSDSTPWVGQIVDNQRIDGVWTMGRWDLRRRVTQNSLFDSPVEQ